MSTPYLGEIRISSFAFAPKGWALCNGQLLPISQNQALFAILGTTYGGDGRVTFGLPDMRGRSPVHSGSALPLGTRTGEEAHALTTSEMPGHSHALHGNSDVANTTTPAGTLPAAKGRGGKDLYASGGSAPLSLHPQAIANAGAGQPHDNMSPFLTLNFIIALVGVFPPRA